MQRRIFFIVVAFLSLFEMRGEDILQIGKNFRKEVVKDTAKMEVVYVHVAQDPILKKKDVKYEMLVVGDRFRKYFGYDNYRLDSIYINTPDLEFKNDNEKVKFWRQFEKVKESLFIDPESQELMFMGGTLLDYYRYTEQLADIEWRLEEDTEEILGYDCRKATARWRGRDWTAWYCDLPIDGGPWKFRGLPGLIMKLSDDTGDHYFEAMGFKDDVFPFGYKKRDYYNTTREKYNVAYKDYCENIGSFIVNSGLVQQMGEDETEIRKRRLFFSPIELE